MNKYFIPLKSVLIALSLVLLVLLGFWGYGETKRYFTDPSPKRVIEEVGKLVELPPDEIPTVATVTDLEPLKFQPFFEEAKVGDKVLIFSQAGKVVLYRPSEKKIIAVGPITR